MASPLESFAGVRRKEWPLALAMFGYFFLVISVFWVLKLLKKTQFIDYYQAHGNFELLGWSLKGSQAELLAKVLNMVVAFAAVIAFTALSRRLYRQKLSFVFTAFCAACLVGYAFLIDRPGEATVWHFYLFGDLFNTLMVATFFAFLNDSFTPEAAKRVYGVIVLGGVAGGAFGSLVVRAQIDDLTIAQWMWISVGATAAIAALAWTAGRLVDRDPAPAQDNDPSLDEQGNAALAGARLVFRSRYLLAIVAMVGLYEMVSTILDFQFTATVEHFVEDTGEHFATMGVITNVFALAVQLFATSFIMTRFGLGAALLVMPAAIVGSSAVFLAIPALWIGSALNTADNGLNYGLNQSARETLYTATSRDEKYKAKAFIDMFVQRFAKAVAVGLALLITSVFTSFSGVRWLSLVTLGLTAAWILAARYAGRRFHELTDF